MSDNAFRFSGAAAANYDRWLGPFLFEPSSAWMVARVPEEFSGRILEVAAGTGRLTRHLAQKLGASGSLAATDLSEDMLDLARQKVNHPAVSFQTADAQALPFPDDHFDLVICQYGLMFLPDKQKGFDEAHRVLKPGGKYLFSTWDDIHTMPVLDIVFGQTITPFFGGQVDKYLVPFHMHHPEILSSHLEKAGFHHIDVDRMYFEGPVQDVEQLVNGFLLHHSLGREVLEKDPEALPVLAESLRSRLLARFGIGSFTCSLQAWLGQGMK